MKNNVFLFSESKFYACTFLPWQKKPRICFSRNSAFPESTTINEYQPEVYSEKDILAANLAKEAADFVASKPELFAKLKSGFTTNAVSDEVKAQIIEQILKTSAEQEFYFFLKKAFALEEFIKKNKCDIIFDREGFTTPSTAALFFYLKKRSRGLNTSIKAKLSPCFFLRKKSIKKSILRISEMNYYSLLDFALSKKWKRFFLAYPERIIPPLKATIPFNPKVVLFGSVRDVNYFASSQHLISRFIDKGIKTLFITIGSSRRDEEKVYHLMSTNPHLRVLFESEPSVKVRSIKMNLGDVPDHLDWVPFFFAKIMSSATFHLSTVSRHINYIGSETDLVMRVAGRHGYSLGLIQYANSLNIHTLDYRCIPLSTHPRYISTFAKYFYTFASDQIDVYKKIDPQARVDVLGNLPSLHLLKSNNVTPGWRLGNSNFKHYVCYMQQHSHLTINLKIISQINQAAEDNPDTLFIIKWHPKEIHDLVVTLESNLRLDLHNILIDRESISNAIIQASDATLTMYSTTGYDAAFQNKVLVIFKEKPTDKYPIEFEDYTHKITVSLDNPLREQMSAIKEMINTTVATSLEDAINRNIQEKIIDRFIRKDAENKSRGSAAP